MKLNSNIKDYMVSFDQLHSDPFDLLSYMNDRIIKFDDKNENIVLFTHKR
jgi:hypothetical protein